jgi:hypothetical protein
MKKLMQVLLIGAVVAFIGGTVAVAADMPESAVGTWTLNLAKSKFNPGPAPKSQTRTYAQSAEGVTFSIKGVAADGSPMSQQSTFKYDGKDYSITGNNNYDMLSLTRIDANTIKSTMKKDGKAVGTTTRQVSADGKVLTVTTKGTDAKGGKFEDVAVYDRQ